mmetsp:Transcript_41535/g.93858  ORF Transcript_41535/g.93858 Transcript_41535/m.93858 type:complete len:84 (-) Transcript_41535:39-290(-)
MVFIYQRLTGDKSSGPGASSRVEHTSTLDTGAPKIFYKKSRGIDHHGSENIRRLGHAFDNGTHAIGGMIRGASRASTASQELM